MSASQAEPQLISRLAKPTSHRAIKWGVVIGLLLASFAHGEPDAEQATPRLEYGRGKEMAKLADPNITESSGMAASRINQDIFWTHNDSGDSARVFAFDKAGKSVATLTITGAHASDWEDMASFTVKGRGVLLLADVGDNAARRESVTLYAIYEPKLNPKRVVNRDVPVAQTIKFKYEDGPHNCESIAVDPTDETIYIVTKVGGNACKVYALPWPKPGSDQAPFVAKAIATLKMPAATAMDISPDGMRAVVLTYGDAFEYTRDKGQTWAQAFSKPGRRIKMPLRVQGESICYGSDGKALFLTSECKWKDSTYPSPLLQVPVIDDVPNTSDPVKPGK